MPDAAQPQCACRHASWQRASSLPALARTNPYVTKRRAPVPAQSAVPAMPHARNQVQRHASEMPVRRPPVFIAAEDACRQLRPCQEEAGRQCRQRGEERLPRRVAGARCSGTQVWQV